ncbi:MAG: SH3 domain-containing protein [Hyphomicrobiales bacterium]
MKLSVCLAILVPVVFLMPIYGLMSAQAQHLEVPVIEYADEDLPTCSFGRVKGLKADGDGFLAVRSGPASSYRKLDELVNGDEVWMYDKKGRWIGVLYAAENPGCGPVKKNRPVPYKGKKGWVHENWIELISG